MTLHLDWLTEIDGDYAYVTDGDGPGSLVVRADDGDTLFPPYEGRYTVLDSADSRPHALAAARQWDV